VSEIKNRSRRAREHAGLSIAQAATMLGLTKDELILIEERDSCFADANQAKMADTYAVNIEWLSGDADLRDYESIKGMRGADNLTFHDRDIIAEFAASMPRSRPKTLAEVANSRDQPPPKDET